MNSNLHLLDTLKEKLVSSDNFSEVMHYFFDHFAENEAFLELGRLRHSSLIETIAHEAAASALGEKVVIHNMRLVRLAQQKFCHGPCFVNHHIATLFFFEDIQTGMMAIALSSASGQMLYARITAVAVPNRRSAKWN
jgi:hypothetical protein